MLRKLCVLYEQLCKAVDRAEVGEREARGGRCRGNGKSVTRCARFCARAVTQEPANVCQNCSRAFDIDVEINTHHANSHIKRDSCLDAA